MNHTDCDDNRWNPSTHLQNYRQCKYPVLENHSSTTTEVKVIWPGYWCSRSYEQECLREYWFYIHKYLSIVTSKYTYIHKVHSFREHSYGSTATLVLRTTQILVIKELLYTHQMTCIHLHCKNNHTHCKISFTKQVVNDDLANMYASDALVPQPLLIDTHCDLRR